MSQRTLNWPRRIARSDRTPLSTGHGSFFLQRTHLGDDAYDRQRIRLSGYLLVLAREGSVILDHGQYSVLLREGDAILIPAGEFAITEIPRPQFSRGVTAFYFFNQLTLADLVAGRGGIDAFAARICLPVLPIYPVQRLGAALDAAAAMGSLKLLTDLRAVFTGLLAARPAMTLTFLKHHLFVPRLRLCLFLEAFCMGKVDQKRIASLYPVGAAAFRRNCADYLGLPVEQWLFRRRIEMAQHLLRHTDRTEHEAASQLGYTDLRRFRGDMKRFGRFSPLELATLRLLCPKDPDRQSRVPSWFPDGDARMANQRQRTADACTLAMLAPSKADQRALLKKYAKYGSTGAWHVNEVCLTAPLTCAAETANPVQQEALPDNVITLEAVEKWRIGEFALAFGVPLHALAA